LVDRPEGLFRGRGPTPRKAKDSRTTPATRRSVGPGTGPTKLAGNPASGGRPGTPVLWASGDAAARAPLAAVAMR